jgi:hypothetical protein
MWGSGCLLDVLNPEVYRSIRRDAKLSLHCLSLL